MRHLKPSEPRAQEADFEAAKRTEVDGLIKRNIWATVNKCDISSNVNVVDGRFILSLKHVETPEEVANVRYVAQGYADSKKPYFMMYPR